MPPSTASSCPVRQLARVDPERKPNAVGRGAQVQKRMEWVTASGYAHAPARKDKPSVPQRGPGLVPAPGAGRRGIAGSGTG